MVITDNIISSFYSQYLGVNINMSKCGVCLQPNKALSTYVTILARLHMELIFIRQFTGFRCWICPTDYLFSLLTEFLYLYK